MYRFLSIFAEDVSYVPLPFPRLASFPQGFANSFENVGFLSNYLTSKPDSVSLSRLSATNWHTFVTMCANSNSCPVYMGTFG